MYNPNDLTLNKLYTKEFRYKNPNISYIIILIYLNSLKTFLLNNLNSEIIIIINLDLLNFSIYIFLISLLYYLKCYNNLNLLTNKLNL